MDTRTTVRWSEGERAWLEGRARARGSKVGSVVREVVQAAMAGEVRLRRVGRVPAARPLASSEAASGGGVMLGAAGAASDPRPGAAPAVARVRVVRLDVAVAHVLSGAERFVSGLQTPRDLARARRAIADGRVTVSGRGAHELAPGLHVGAGEVWVDGVQRGHGDG